MGTKRAMTSIESDQKTHSYWGGGGGRKGREKNGKGGETNRSAAAVLLLDLALPLCIRTEAYLPL